jgi:predicted CxxxxCH...CXXCH cytochrome family protein
MVRPTNPEADGRVDLAETRADASRLAAIASLLMIACGEPVPELPELTSWREDVAPVFEEACASCHGPGTPAAGYSVASYLEAVGPGAQGERMAVAGDAQSPLLERLAEDAHGAHLAEDPDLRDFRRRLVRHWVVDSRLAYFRSEAHPPGILDRDGAKFHGREIAGAGYRMSACRECHGEDYAGGAGPSCLSCHPATPEACGTCHASPRDPPPFRGLGGATDPSHPAVGAHDIHVHGGAYSVGTACRTCHPAREAIDADGHRDGSVSLHFSGVAAVAGLSPTWDATSRTCANTWCHGGGLEDRNVESPPWTSAGAAPCGSCHTIPPETLSTGGPHPDVETCGGCHGMVIDDAWRWVDRARHVDGIIDR